MEKEISAKFKRKQTQRKKKKKQTDKQGEALRIGKQDAQDDSQEDTKDGSAVKMEINQPQTQ